MLKGIDKLIDSTDPTRDLKLASFGVVVIFGVCKLALNKIDASWVQAFTVLCATVGLGGLGLAAIETIKGSKKE